jgi:hypothetical protein
MRRLQSEFAHAYTSRIAGETVSFGANPMPAPKHGSAQESDRHPVLRGFCGFGNGASRRFRDARSARRPMIAGLSGGFFECDCGWQESLGRSRFPQAGPGERHAWNAMLSPGIWCRNADCPAAGTANLVKVKTLATPHRISSLRLWLDRSPIPPSNIPTPLEPGRVRSLLGQTASPDRTGALGILPTEGQTLKSPPIGHFVRFSLRAQNTSHASVT